MLRKTVSLIIILLIFSGCSGNNNNNDAHKSTNRRNFSRAKSFIFVGIHKYRASLYKYDFKSKKISLFWDNPDESVVELSYSTGMKTAFFLTASDYGERGAFPFIDNAKIYMFNADSGNADFIESIGSGIQVYMAWAADNSFKVILNSFDKTVANYVNQHTKIFNTYGKMLFDEVKTYDLTIDGYPKPEAAKPDYDSPGGKYTLKFYTIADSLPVRQSGSIYLQKKKSREKYFITKTNQNLNQAEWSPNDNYLVFSTLNISPVNKTLNSSSPETSCLYLYSMKSKRLLNKWIGSGLKNFYIINNLLIFDNGFGNHSSIYFLNYKTLKPYDRIEIKYGCGLRNIPRLPGNY